MTFFHRISRRPVRKTTRAAKSPCLWRYLRLFLNGYHSRNRRGMPWKRKCGVRNGTFFMRIATWKVNSVRQRLDYLVTWLRDCSPDIVCLQEIKCLDEAFPREPLEALGYN